MRYCPKYNEGAERNDCTFQTRVVITGLSFLLSIFHCESTEVIATWAPEAIKAEDLDFLIFTSFRVKKIKNI